MEGAWPASPAAARAVSRSAEPGGEAQDGRAGRRWSGQLLIGHDGRLLRGPAATEKGEWARRGQGGRRCPAVLPGARPRALLSARRASRHTLGGREAVCVPPPSFFVVFF